MAALTSSSCLTSGQMKIPVIGLGTWQASPEEIDLAVKTAIEAGYRHFDTAYAYFNEEAIGKSLQNIFNKGLVTREDVFIVTKLPHIGNRAEYVEKYITASLSALQMDYVDLYLIHMPVGFKNVDEELFHRDANGELELDMETDHIQLWKAMEEQVDAGRAKSIGVSNFNLKQVKRLLDNCRIPPACNQVELHIYLQQPELVSFCQQNNVVVCAYGPLGSAHAPNFAKAIGGSPDSTPKLEPLSDPVILEIAETHRKTPAQVLLRYLIEYGVAVIPKSVNPQRIIQNIQIFDFELSADEFVRIKGLDLGEKGRLYAENNDFYKAMKKHPEYPFSTSPHEEGSDAHDPAHGKRTIKSSLGYSV